MIKTLFPIACTLLLFSCSSSGPDVADGDSVHSDSAVAPGGDSSSIGGVYSFGENPEVEAVGTLFVFPESDSTFLFYLDFNRGAPSYNMGQLANRAKLKDNVWIYYHEEEGYVEACEIEFSFRKKFAQIITRQNVCDFGANVIVDHVYNRISLVAPGYFVGPEGDSVFFKDLGKTISESEVPDRNNLLVE